MVVCPECGAPMVLRETTKFTYKNGDPRKFYGCSRFPACRAAHGAHPDGKPMGVPANLETKQARMAAHAAFDAHWQKRGLSKKQAYLFLQDVMGMTAAEAHIANFDKAQCELLVQRIKAQKEPSTMKFYGLTFSGPDSNTDISALVEIQKNRPHVEIGVLWSLSNAGKPRYATREWIEKASEAGLNFAIHLCGKVCRDCVEGTETPVIPGTPRRVQFNINGMYGMPAWYRVFESIQSRHDHKLQFIIQTCDSYGPYVVGLAQGEGHNCVPLFDQSGGKGHAPNEWPRPLPYLHCGFAGGISPPSIENTVKQLLRVSGETFWLDMESKIRVNDRFDLETIHKILKITDPLINMA